MSELHVCLISLTAFGHANGPDPLALLWQTQLVRPLDVKIVGPQRPLAASGQASEFGCVSSGSRPPARLTWLKNGRRLDPKLWRQAESARNASAASTTSKLLIKLEPDDHGAQLTCRAENPAKGAVAVVGHEPEGDTSNETNSDGWTLEDSIILSVQCEYSSLPRNKLPAFVTHHTDLSSR